MCRIGNARLWGLALMGALVFWVSLSQAADNVLWNGEPVALRQIKIQVSDDHPDGFDWQGLASALMDQHIQRDELLTPANLKQATEAVADFGQVSSSVVVSNQQADLTMVLIPYKRIKSIAVSGNYPLFNQDVLIAMQVAIGDIFRPEAMAEQKQLITRRFQAEGYVDPQVRITWTTDEDDGHYHLSIAIDKGPFYALSEVRWLGRRALSESLLNRQLASGRLSALWGAGERFKPRQLKDDVRKLIALYRKQGYADIVVQADTTLFPDQQRAQLDFTLEEGVHYQVGFTGNHFFSDHTLRQDLALVEIGNLGNKGLRRSVQTIRRRYLQAGFAEVQVNWQDQPAQGQPSGLRQVVIEIQEGARHMLDGLRVKGNRYLNDKTIQQAVLSRPSHILGGGAYVAGVLEEDLAAVRALYLEHGFVSAQVKEVLRIDPVSHKVGVTLTVEEGVQTRVGQVSIQGDPPLSVKELMRMVQVKPGEPFQHSMIQNDENRLSARIASLGYPHVQVQGRSLVSADQSRADIVYQIDSGPLVHVGKIFFTGNFRTRDGFLHRRMGVDPGALFSLEKILTAQRDLRNLELFESLQLRSIGLKEKQSTVPLLVTMIEKKPYYFELGGGYQSDKGVYGRTKVGDNNLLGTGKKGWLGSEISQVGYLCEAGLTEPRLFGSRFSADAGLFYQRTTPFNQDVGTDATGATMAISRTWEPNLTAALGLRYEQREQFPRNEQAVLSTDPAVFEPRSIVVTTPSIRFDDRDSFIRPKKGRIVSLSVEIAKGLDNELDDFVKYRFDGRIFHSPLSRVVLAGRIGAGYLQPYGAGGDTPEDQLFFLGGTNAVRGFGENLLRHDPHNAAVGGRLMLMGSVEARLDLGRNWEATAFVDTGSVRQAPDATGSDDFRWSAGLGLGYITPIGPVGLFYGHKIDPQPGESSGQWHLTIGYIF